MNDDMRIEQDERISAGRGGQRRSRRFPRLVALVVVLAFVGIVWYAFSQGQQMGISQVTPVIKADNEPFKVKPEQPGGMEIPHQDKMIYEELQGKNAEQVPEKLLPPPEKPVDMAAAETPAVEPLTPVTDPSQPLPTQNVAERPAPAMQHADPKIEELKPIAPVTPQKTEPTPAPVKKAEPKPEIKAEPKAEAKVEKKPAATGGSSRIQLASLPDKGQAEKAAASVKSKFSDLLDGRTVTVRAAQIPGKGIFYRVQVDGYKDKDSAQQACAAFKAKGQGCIYVAPSV